MSQPTPERRKEDMYRIGRIEATLEAQDRRMDNLYTFIKEHMVNEEKENKIMRMLIGAILLIHFFDLTWSQAIAFITKLIV